MGRKSLKEIRQKEIISGFYQVAKEIGLENASIAKVANHLNINPSLILHYFKTREELLFGLISFILESYSEIYAIESEDNLNLAKLQSVIDVLFSRKWDELFDDGVFFSCYSMIYRDESIKKSFKKLHDSLRLMLAGVLENYRDEGIISIDDPLKTAERIFILIEGAYYYLGMIDDLEEYEKKVEDYKALTYQIINISVEI
ncbi:TetR family transcriptional regulator [Flammeovirgaceae bacterium SG7u.111]|nr:TetR family transcriptional regulator [Flammeovirgaceae bacterium SG7u.132]WPO34895.1 TetR family transcriptional regulator [Flammeovirgaceae bacterium SG7u.111]